MHKYDTQAVTHRTRLTPSHSLSRITALEHTLLFQRQCICSPSEVATYAIATSGLYLHP